MSSDTFRSEVYDHMNMHKFDGTFIDDFATSALAIIREYDREITILEKFGHDAKEIAEYLCRYIRIKPYRSGNFIKEVNNDTKGWEEIIKIKEFYKSRGRAIRLRGRGKNRAARMAAAGLYYNHTHDLAIKVSDRIAIYER